MANTTNSPTRGTARPIRSAVRSAKAPATPAKAAQATKAAQAAQAAQATKAAQAAKPAHSRGGRAATRPATAGAGGGANAPASPPVTLVSCCHRPAERVARNGRIDEYFDVVVTVGGFTTDAKVHAMRLSAREAWVASFRGNEKAAVQALLDNPQAMYWGCPTCKDTLQRPLAEAIFPALHAAGIPIALPKPTGTRRGAHAEPWWLFEMQVPPTGAFEPTGCSRPVHAELVIVQYAVPVACPIHGALTVYEDEPID